MTDPESTCRTLHTPIHIISLGAGVQSSAMSIMACHGKIKPMPSLAIFADTGDEPREVYAWLKELCKMLTFPVVELQTGKLSQAIVNKWGFSQIPAWFRSAKTGKASIGRRQCTKYFKIVPIRREIRSRYPNQPIVMWQGISTDEVSRCKDSERQWLTHRFPLIEQNISRQDCETFLRSVTSWTVPKSACVYCPYRSDAQWQQTLKRPYEMEIVRRVEATLLPRNEFLNRRLQPVDSINFTQNDPAQVDMFNNECEGMCGV